MQFYISPFLLKFTIIVGCLIIKANSFNFADLFGDGESGSRDKDPNSDKSEETFKKTICPFFQCSDGTCVADPIDCLCPEGMRKCYLGDWYICVPGNESCPTGTCSNQQKDE